MECLKMFDIKMYRVINVLTYLSSSILYSVQFCVTWTDWLIFKHLLQEKKQF